MNLRCQSFRQGRWPRMPRRQWPTGHRPCAPRGGRTPAMARPVRPERAQRCRAPAAHSTRPLSLSLARSTSPKHHTELVERRRSSTVATRYQRSLTG